MSSNNLLNHTTQYKHVAVPVNVGRCAIHTDTTDGLRLWLIARAIDTTGTGKTTKTALYEALPVFGVSISYGYFRKILNRYTGTHADGRDDTTPVKFWNYNPTTGVMYLHSVSNVGAELYKATIDTATSDQHKQILVNNMPTHRRVFVPVNGSIGLFNAELYKAWISVHGGKLSRDTMTVLFNVSDQTQRHYERVTGVTVERTDISVYGSELAQAEHGVLIPIERAQARHTTNDTQYIYQHTNRYTAHGAEHKPHGQAKRVKNACLKVLSTYTPVINRVNGQKLYFDDLRAYNKHVKRHGHSDNMLVFTVWTNTSTGTRRLVYRQMVSICCAQNFGHNRVLRTYTTQVTAQNPVKRVSSAPGQIVAIQPTPTKTHQTDNTQSIPDIEPFEVISARYLNRHNDQLKTHGAEHADGRDVTDTGTARSDLRTATTTGTPGTYDAITTQPVITITDTRPPVHTITTTGTQLSVTTTGALCYTTDDGHTWHVIGNTHRYTYDQLKTACNDLYKPVHRLAQQLSRAHAQTQRIVQYPDQLTNISAERAQ